jgi:TonB family protein
MAGGLMKSDNPGGRFQGTVSVRFTVALNGQVTGCTPTRSSGKRALDARTCALVEQRLKFLPARDWQGHPIASEMYATYTWGRTHRALIDWLLQRRR